MRLAVGVLALVIALLIDARAWAAMEMRTTAGGPVEAGDDVEVQLHASTDGDLPTDPQLTVPKGMRVTGTTSMRSRQVSAVNGVVTMRDGVNVTFTVHTSTVGTFTVTPSVKVGGVRTTAPATTIKVVAAGTLPQQPRQGFNPFDPFGFFNNDPLLQEPELPQFLVDPKLGLAAPRGASAFLHATVDKSRAVVGEQVTLTIYLYVDTQTREPDFADAHEATSNDFLRKSLMKDDATSEDAGYASVAGRTYLVRVLRRVALFPLKTGDLEIGAMSLTLAPKGGVRESEKLTVMVVDAPLAGRPAGYETGNVGRFAISADVDPRTAERGSVVGVNVTLSGTGNLPGVLPIPLQSGVKWLEPELHEKMTNLAGRYGGERSFSYVVRTEREGDVDLGAIEVPFYDPDAHKYDVARVALGVVKVTHSDAPAPETAAPALPELPSMRRSLGGGKPRVAHWTDRAWSWGLLGFAPLSFVLLTASRSLAKRARARAAEKKSSPAALLRDKENALQSALASDDAGAIDAAAIRMLESAVLAHLGKNLRAATGATLVRELEEAGASKQLGQELRDLLSSCESARFAPDSTSTSAARERAASARKIARALAKAKSR